MKIDRHMYNTKDRQKQIFTVKHKDRKKKKEKQKGRSTDKRNTDRRKRKQLKSLNYLYYLLN